MIYKRTKSKEGRKEGRKRGSQKGRKEGKKEVGKREKNRNLIKYKMFVTYSHKIIQIPK